MQRFLALFQSSEAGLQTLDREGVEVIVEETTIRRRFAYQVRGILRTWAHCWGPGEACSTLSHRSGRRANP